MTDTPDQNAPDGAALQRTLVLRNRRGLHARASAKFVQCVAEHGASVRVSQDDVVADGASIMGLLTLAAPVGSSITVTAEGENAEAVLNALEQLIEGKFDEE